jgi:hypothetical protein
MAYAFLKRYARLHDIFSGEEVRVAAYEHAVPPSPSDRAWGGVIKKAAHEGVIRQIGYIKVRNPRARRANAALWESCIY